MPSFLTNNTAQCCCPEMRCCAPNTVSVTSSGWMGIGVSQWVRKLWVGGDNIPPLPPGTLELEIGKQATAYEAGITGDIYYFEIEYNEQEQRVTFTSRALYPAGVGVVWPSVAFPQMNPVVEGNSFGCGVQYGVVSGFVADEAVAEKCDSALTEKLCEKPAGGADDLVYGPAGFSNGGFVFGRTNLTDLNDTYVCHRLYSDMRPEMAATVIRTSADSTSHIDARIVFDVYCRRRWATVAACPAEVILNLTCAVSDNPPDPSPEGQYFCVDYRCGLRGLPEYEGGSLCSQHKCSAHEGTVLPHLMAFPESGNYTAVLKLNLTPDAYFRNTDYSYQGAKPQKALSWKVLSATATTPGTGYAVGDFFSVDFDPFWMMDLNGGEINLGFPQSDPLCLNYPLTWRDKYGQEADVDQSGAKRYYQRLRVQAVDAGGGITAFEVVPWYRTPEFRPGSCIDEVPQSQRTPYYPAYSRVICHPNSVDIGGTGYNVGDTIHFEPLSPGVEVYEATTASVTDVDDDGAVLDWEVRGSDIWRYGFGLGNPACNIYGEPDERGAYRWADKYDLCDLYWQGVGVPVREVAPYFDGGSCVETFVNTGQLTSTSVRVRRVYCRTKISVVVSQYAYDTLSFQLATEDEDATLETRLLKLCPPYPRGVGGGAQITPIIGTDGGNESAIGGPLGGGTVKSGGGYYAYVEKYHAEPILPKSIPAIGSGGGAAVGDFTFASVLNFPSPGYAAGQPKQPASNRFSYYPVTGATVASGGSGYEVGQEFDVAPDGGTAYSRPWSRSGGDDPDESPNGNWYAGELAYTNQSGYVVIEQGTVRASLCRLRVAAVDQNGAIQSLAVVHGGMMYRTLWGSGVRHPDVTVEVGSDTGFGARATVAVDANKTSSKFGEVISCQIVQIPVSEQQDPLHSTPENPVPYPLGGRDYANPKSGLMWELDNITIRDATMMSYIVWHGWIYDYYHPQNSTHELVEGSLPPFHRRAQHCTLDECYHSLLGRSYPLYRIWAGSAVNGPYPGGNDTYNRVFGLRGCADPPGPSTYSPLPDSATYFLSGKPKVPYGLFRRKGTRSDVFMPGPDGVDCDENNVQEWNYRWGDMPGYTGLPPALVNDWVVIEWGYGAALSASIPVYPNCPDYEDGRTSR